MSIPKARAALDLPTLLAALAEAGWQGPIPTILDTTESTNADVAGLAAAGAEEGSCIVAEHQSAGRGRLDRDWVSPQRAGLTMSILVRPARMAPESWGWLPLIAGLATAEAIRACTGVPAQVKWPNDLVVLDAQARKLGGILTEALNEQTVVVGIGLNITTTSSELPIPTATSVQLEGGRIDREVLLAGILTAFASRLAQWRMHDPALHTDYRDHCASIGREVVVTLPDAIIVRGQVVDVDESGHLVVNDGTTNVIVTAGDVIHATI